MSTNPNPIPPPTERDLKINLDACYEFIENDESKTADFARSLIRLLAAERAQNAERGEIVKGVLKSNMMYYETQLEDGYVTYECTNCGRWAYDSKESVTHRKDCLVERARRAGVPV